MRGTDHDESQQPPNVPHLHGEYRPLTTKLEDLFSVAVHATPTVDYSIRLMMLNIGM